MNESFYKLKTILHIFVQLGSAETLAQVNVIAKSNVVTETEHESALEQISYLETSSEQRFHQVTVINN